MGINTNGMARYTDSELSGFKTLSLLKWKILRQQFKDLRDALNGNISNDDNREAYVILKAGSVTLDKTLWTRLLPFYRDFYKPGTKRMLAVYDVKYEQLGPVKKAALDTALTEMNRDPRGLAGSGRNSKNRVATIKITERLKGNKAAVLNITALEGEGYPSPVNFTAK